MSHSMVSELKEAMQEAGDSQKAVEMQAYLKTSQEFYGVQAKARQTIFKEIVKRYKTLTRAEYEQIIFKLWEGQYREDMYQALETAQYYKVYRDLESWPIYERLVRSATNWDTLDWVVGRIVSPLLVKQRDLEEKLVAWSHDDNFWVRRASLLAHLQHKEKTNSRLLANTILTLAHEKEFFIRKAIGWVLRDYSRTNPAWVETFVTEHQQKLLEKPGKPIRLQPWDERPVSFAHLCSNRLLPGETH